jgi:transcriptional regulator NrdR family protein
LRTAVVPTAIKRRRECLRCKHRWATAELPADELDALQRIRDLARPLADVVR